MDKSKESWDHRWQEKSVAPLEPDPWLRRALPWLPGTGKVLDIACGRGRNALYLAERGFLITGIDISQTGLSLLRQEAKKNSLHLELQQTDLELAEDLPAGPFDIILNFFYLQRSLFPCIKRVLSPGGIAVIRTFSIAGGFPAGPSDPAFHLQPHELLEIFSGWEILLHEEGVEQARNGGGLAGIVARKA